VPWQLCELKPLLNFRPGSATDTHYMNSTSYMTHILENRFGRKSVSVQGSCIDLEVQKRTASATVRKI
jgi:hypothetical protein